MKLLLILCGVGCFAVWVFGLFRLFMNPECIHQNPRMAYALALCVAAAEMGVFYCLLPLEASS